MKPKPKPKAIGKTRKILQDDPEDDRDGVLFDLEKHGISQGLLGMFCNCEQMAAYRVRGWEPEQSKRALRFGSLVHNILEWMYKNSPERMDPVQALGATIGPWKAQGFKEGIDAQELEDDLGTIRALAIGYAKHWQKRDREKKWVRLEGLFDHLLTGYRLRGRVDGVYQDRSGKLWLFETKTASVIDEEAMGLALQFDWQTGMYAYVMGRILGKPIIGVQYNVIRKPGLKINKDGDRDDLRKRIDADIQERPDHYFKRFQAVWSERERTVFEGELMMKLFRLREWVMKGAVPCRNQAACIGKWSCRYLRACATGSMDGYRLQETFDYPELAEGGD